MHDLLLLSEMVHKIFPRFGINKRRVIERLVFEIAKREAIPFQAILSSLNTTQGYDYIKNILVERRYPELSQKGIKIKNAFPAIEIHPQEAALIKGRELFRPKVIYVEKEAQRSALADRFINLFPSSSVVVIENYKTFCAQRDFTVVDYNQRAGTYFLIREKYHYFKPCPCSPGSISCGYHYVNLGFGCPYECSYCFLQNYTNSPGIVFPVNLADFFDAFLKYDQSIRVGSGECTDSLVFDHITNYSLEIVDFFRRHQSSMFEFKTKSNNVTNLLSVKSASNVVVGWSLNPQKIIDTEEFFTASLKDRLEAAKSCAEAGYRTAFHFDPIIVCEGWEEIYADLVDQLVKVVPVESIAWVSLGTLRMTVSQKKIIENRFPANTILNAEMVVESDGKYRYPEYLRRDIYRKMLAYLKKHLYARTVRYICMDSLVN